MRKVAFFLIFLLVCAGVAMAQEGHPLTGSWHGEWQSGSGAKNPVMIYMKWDSKNITGIINPGPNATSIKAATLDANNWTVHLEGDTKDNQHIVIDGKLDNIGSYNRTITGTWMQGNTKGELKLTRD
jgi:hypothetical protein